MGWPFCIRGAFERLVAALDAIHELIKACIIHGGLSGNAMGFIRPGTKVDHLAAFGTKRTPRVIAGPVKALAALGARDDRSLILITHGALY